MTLTREQALENLGGEEVAHRQDAERLWLAKQLAYAAYDAAFDARPRHESTYESDAHPDVAPLKAAFDAAETAWLACETNGDVMVETEDGEPRRCALTNCIIHDEDDYVEHPGTGQCLLVDALGLEDSVHAALTCRDDDGEGAVGEDDAANDDDSEAA